MGLIFIERAALRDRVVVETASGSRPPSGFWRGTDFYRIVRVAERRIEHDAVYLRVITDRGYYDLRRAARLDPWTLRPSIAWELTAELEAIEVQPRR